MPGLVPRTARAALRALPLHNGKGRIVDRTFLSALTFDESVLDVTTAEGFTMRVFPNDLIGRHIYLTGRFDRCVVEVLEEYSAPEACLWDVGANIGYVSCAFLDAVPGSFAVAVEPLADVAELLGHNLEQFGRARSAVVEAAVSDHVGTATMVRVDGNLGNSHVDTTAGGGDVRLVSGETLGDIRMPSAIKIDVEGHELAVLRGIAGVIAAERPAVIVFEHHTQGRAVDPQILQIFDDLRYSVLRINRKWSGWRLAPHHAPLDGYEPSADFVALPV